MLYYIREGEEHVEMKQIYRKKLTPAMLYVPMSHENNYSAPDMPLVASRLKQDYV